MLKECQSHELVVVLSQVSFRATVRLVYALLVNPFLIYLSDCCSIRVAGRRQRRRLPSSKPSPPPQLLPPLIRGGRAWGWGHRCHGGIRATDATTERVTSLNTPSATGSSSECQHFDANKYPPPT